MSVDFKRLEKDIDKQHKRKGRGKKYLGHKTHWTLYLSFLVLIAIILILGIAYLNVTAKLEAQGAAARQQIEKLGAELEACHEAEEIAVEDAQALGRIFGVAYANTTENTPLAPEEEEDAPAHVVILPRVNVWEEYARQEIVSGDCLATTKVIETGEGTVAISVNASGRKRGSWPRMSILVDGTIIATVTVDKEGGAIYKRYVELPRGTHYLDLLYDNGLSSGSLTINQVRVGNRLLGASTGLLDYGSGFGPFDCEELAEGNWLEENGAMRFKLEKI